MKTALCVLMQSGGHSKIVYCRKWQYIIGHKNTVHSRYLDILNQSGVRKKSGLSGNLDKWEGQFLRHKMKKGLK